MKHDQGGDDLLAQVFASEYTVIGSTGRRDLEDIAWTPSGLVALGGGAIYSISTTTGAATLIGGDGFAGDEQSLTYHPDLGLLVCGSVLSSVNQATGTATGIGPTGFTRITGLAAVYSCYVNCDTGGPPPALNVNDFVCFMVQYANGHPYANCDGSTAPPVLNVNDFVCFMSLWGAGCP